MLANTKAYSGIAVKDMDKAREFYAETLGLRTSEEYGLMWLHLAGAVDTLAARGVRFERYDGGAQDDRGVFRDEGPYIAWFKDPSGNVLSVLQER